MDEILTSRNWQEKKVPRRSVFQVLGFGTFALFATEALAAGGGNYLLASSHVKPPGHDVWTAVDTMADSRDRAREGLSKEWIGYLVSEVKELHATHISIATPYDTEFIPVYVEWVKKARLEGLKVLHRGVIPEWGGLFGRPNNPNPTKYPDQIHTFITENSYLFKDGDKFDPCPEPENQMDVFKTPQNKYAYRRFIVNLHQASRAAFSQINKNIEVITSMNGDMPRLLGFDPVDKLDVVSVMGSLSLDHETADPLEMGTRIQSYQHFGVPIYLTECGVPDPTITGGNPLPEEEQPMFVQQLFKQMIKNNVSGIDFYSLVHKFSHLLENNDSNGKYLPSHTRENGIYPVVKEYFTRLAEHEAS